MSSASSAELLARLRQTPQLVREAALRIPDAGPLRDPAAGWSPAQVVVHLAAVDAEVWCPRLRQLAVEGHPRWSWSEPDMSGRDASSTDAALREFETARGALVAQVTALDTAGWRRTGTHAVFGELDAEGLLRQALSHDLEHLADLENLVVTSDA